MNDAMPIVAAIAVSEGQILAVGSKAHVEQHRTSETIVIDLNGHTLLPGFIDAHSHFTMAMKTVRWADLSPPPVGTVSSIPELIFRLKEKVEAQEIQPGQWICGWGYDPDQLNEDRHPTAQELTKVFPDNPVFLLHTSAHMAVANLKALELAGITIDTPDPENGVIIRDEETGIATGLLQESALYLVFPLLPVPDMKELLALFHETQDYYAQNGITTAQDGLTDFQTYQFLDQLAGQDAFQIDLNLLAAYTDAEKYFDKVSFGQSKNGLLVSGLKIVSDGSPQGKTAFFRKPYLTDVPGCIHQCAGFPTIPQRDLEQLMAHCYTNDIQLYVHANGDGAIELLLDTHEQVVADLELPQSGQRTVVIHSQFVGKDQLDRYKDYGFIPSFFTNHAFFWGDVHLKNLGLQRASFLSPIRSTIDKGIISTNHTDFTVTPLNPLFLLWSSVNRMTRSGNVLGADQRITPWEGLKQLTINSAFQHKVEHRKGSLEPGKLADLVILDKNPLKVMPTSIRNIRVMATVKNGKTIYKSE